MGFNERWGVVGRRRHGLIRGAVAALGVALAAQGCAQAVSAAVPDSPKANENYEWASRGFPQLSVGIYVASPPTQAIAVVTCGAHVGRGGRWEGRLAEASSHLRGAVQWRDYAFSFDAGAPIANNGGTYRGTVRFTGRFVGGKFVGTAHIGGASCAQANYTAVPGTVNDIRPE